MKRTEKIIEDYLLEETLEIHPSGIHLIRARHTKTNAQYTIKRVNIEETQNNYGECLLLREVEMLKKINVEGIIKCFKLIRTKRNIYGVFEPYPPHTLHEYIQEFKPSFEERIKYAQNICETVHKLHTKGMVYGNLHPGCILVNAQGLKYVGLEYSSSLTHEQNIEFDNFHEYMASEVIETQKVTVKSDCFSIGKILIFLGVIPSREPEVGMSTPAESLIESLTGELPANRPTLQTVILCLQLSDRTEEVKVQKEVKSKYFRSMSVGRSPLEKVTSKTKSIKEGGEKEKKLRKILKIRNLNLFLIELGRFCLREDDANLCYLLIKKATIISGNLLYEMKMDPLMKRNNLGEALSTLKVEYQEQILFLQKVQQKLKKLENSSLPLPEHKIKEEELASGIREFIRAKRKTLKESKTDFDSDERKLLINLCLLSEKLSHGSFEAFFNESIEESAVDLHSQKYFKYLLLRPNKELLQKIDSI